MLQCEILLLLHNRASSFTHTQTHTPVSASVSFSFDLTGLRLVNRTVGRLRLFVSSDRTGPVSLPSSQLRTDQLRFCDLRRQNQVLPGKCLRHTGCDRGKTPPPSKTATTKKPKTLHKTVSVKIVCLWWSRHYTPSRLKGSSMAVWRQARGQVIAGALNICPEEGALIHIQLHLTHQLPSSPF